MNNEYFYDVAFYVARFHTRLAGTRPAISIVRSEVVERIDVLNIHLKNWPFSHSLHHFPSGQRRSLIRHFVLKSETAQCGHLHS